VRSGGNRSENSQRLMNIAADNVTIDGFYFLKAHGPGSDNINGALNVTGSAATIKNCTFMLNFGSRGTAINFTAGAGHMVEHCVIRHNENWWPGQIFIQGATAIIRNCLFDENVADSDGDGTGVYVAASATGYVYDCTMTRNIASNKMNCGRQGPLTVRSASGQSGHSYLEAKNCAITNNIMPTSFSGLPGGGGAVLIHGSNDTVNRAKALIQNCLIADNCQRNFYASPGTGVTTTGQGGITVAWGADAEIVNCTVVNNTGNLGKGGGVVEHYKGCGINILSGLYTGPYSVPPTVKIRNCIVWGNNSVDVLVEPQAQVLEFNYNCIQNDSPYSCCWGTGVINTDPQFVIGDPLYHVQATSPTIDAGDPASDWSQEPKCNGERINMGWTGGAGKATPKISVANVQDGDVNCDGVVNMTDFSKLASEWLQ
jgi:hypothetical protein